MYKFEREISLDESGNIYLAIVESVETKFGNHEIGRRGFVYNEFELTAVGRGSAVVGKNKVYQALEAQILQGEDMWSIEEEADTDESKEEKPFWPQLDCVTLPH